VTIGRRALVGMGGIVLKDVPEGHVVVGTPVRFLRTTVKGPETNQA
jgi:serine acetyltransferase